MRMNSIVSISLICVALAGVASCGEQSNSDGSAPSARMASQSVKQADLKIVGYGPQGTDAGKAFNVQTSGESALWVKLNHPAAGAGAGIWWGGRKLDSSVSGNVISALVPGQLYENAGRYPLQVRVEGGDPAVSTSNIVYFVVK